MTAKPDRTYSMTNRSAAAAGTREKILQSTLQLATEKLTVEIVLADVADRAGVTVQTILRHFGTRDALFDAAVVYGGDEVVAERETPVGDVGRAMTVIVDHYEARGDWVITLLGQEASDDRIRGITVPGKRVHLQWVQEVFRPQLVSRPDGSRDLVTNLLVVATDVYCWKLLRRDRGLSRAETETSMRTLVSAVLAIPDSALPNASESE
jgi:AcrR family transcriptional regulator